MAAASAQVSASPLQQLGIDRLASADAASMLDRLQGSTLVTEGKITLLGLDAVRERLGERWPVKREQVWEQVERCIARQMGPAVMIVRVCETDYVVAQPAAERWA